MATEDIVKHSVHTLVFRSLKRTHDMFLHDHALALSKDETSEKAKIACKIHDEYLCVKDMVQTKDNTEKPKPQGDHKSSELATILPSPKASGHLSAAKSKALVALGEGGGTKQQTSSALMHQKKAPLLPKPQWHAPWKLLRVISGHTGWVRSVAVEPGNQWFATGSADRTIKIWELGSGKLKLSLTGHISTVRGLVVSPRHPYLFSCGEDKQVKCWDLEYNKVIRHYHGHLSAIHALDLHPSIDVLISCGRDSTARVWDIRTKACIHTLSGHSNTVASVKTQSVEPQIITGSHDCTIRLWDLAAGKSKVTLTNHKKSVRAVILNPNNFTFASASPDNIKMWKFPDGNFLQNLQGHNTIINCLAVNSDNVLVSGGDNGTMHFWDWKTGYNFQRLQGTAQPGSLDSEAGIFAMTFDQSSSRLITCEADKTIKIYKEDDQASEETHPINWKPEILKRKRY